MRYEFHPEALDEYQETTLYYAERDPALALRFVEAVEDAIRRILEAPERWRVLEEDVRRCLTHVFPYGVPVHYRTAVHPYCCCDALQSRVGLLEAPGAHTLTTGSRPAVAKLARHNLLPVAVFYIKRAYG